MSPGSLPVDQKRIWSAVDKLGRAEHLKTAPGRPEEDRIISDIRARIDAIACCAAETIASNGEQIRETAKLFLQWMNDGTIVRFVGAGRARLAASVPANRLAHGGARVFVQGDIIPMPHTINGGGVIAASASGRTPSVLQILREIRDERYHITVVGIAKADADDFRVLCDHFIGIKDTCAKPNPLRALADVGELIIAEVLDALVVAAGKEGGFDDRRWRLGHENLGETGPYDAIAEVQFRLTEPLWSPDVSGGRT